MKPNLVLLALALSAAPLARGQSADWQNVVWREPQVRFLLSDMTLNGGNTSLYRKYAAEERDPDSREAIRPWDAGARVIKTNDFERRWVINRFGKNSRVMRVVFRSTSSTITGDEVLLTSDFDFQQAPGVDRASGWLRGPGARTLSFPDGHRRQPRVVETGIAGCLRSSTCPNP